MTARDRRLAALAALFAPDRARALLARLDDPGGAELGVTAERLARAPRRERLAALAAALPAEPRPAARRDVLARERSGLAAALARVRDRAPGGAPPALLVRLAAERLSRPDA